MSHTSSGITKQTLVLLLASICVVNAERLLSEIFSCDNTRYTGYNNHRTLHIPAAIWDAAESSQEALAWANTLCCVYTWVIRDVDAANAYMITYDGGRRTYTGVTTFTKATEVAYDAICAMYMGSRDCTSCAAPTAVTIKTDAPFLCGKTRNTGYNNHRTLHIPAAIWDAAQSSPDTIAWANTLCCVFTWITRDTNTTHPYMVTYDGDILTYTAATSFSQATEASYDAICTMFMGRQDCESCTAPTTVTSAPDPSEVCASWCAGNDNGWDTKCQWLKSCSGCAECRDVKKKSASSVCTPWCARKKQEWNVKCTWDGCAGCSECRDTPIAAATEDCALWCAGHAKDWDTKCAWSTRSCSGCSECLVANTSDGVEPAGGCGSHTVLSTQEMIQKSPRDDRDAELLALRAGKQLVASDADYQRFAADLKVIRAYHQCEVSAAQDIGTGSVILKFNESSEAFKQVVAGEHKGLDCLNAWYGGRIGLVMKSFGMVTVNFDHIFFSDLIAGAYSSQTDIKLAEPNFMIGDSSDITLCSSSDDGTRRYAFSKGSGDCPAGCINWEHHVFDVTSAGKVTRVSSSKDPRASACTISKPTQGRSSSDYTTCTSTQVSTQPTTVAGPSVILYFIQFVLCAIRFVDVLDMKQDLSS